MKNTEKLTYVDALTVAIDCTALPEGVREKLDALRAQQMKRNSADKKPTKTQQANEVLKASLLELLQVAGKPLTVSEILQMANHPALTSNQKVAALLRLMKDEGSVVRTEEKRKAYFSPAKQG